MVAEKQAVLLEELGPEPVLVFVAQRAALAVFRSRGVLGDDFKRQFLDGGQPLGGVLPDVPLWVFAFQRFDLSGQRYAIALPPNHGILLPMKNYWLMKSEPSEVSVDDALAAPQATVAWTGVRNYQARNFMRDAMRVGDGVLFYHSSCAVPGVVGIAQVASGAYTDPTQFDAQSPYFDAASKPEAPRWLLVEVQVLRKTRNLSVADLRADAALQDLLVLKKGSRLSITPVEPRHWQRILQLLE